MAERTAPRFSAVVPQPPPASSFGAVAPGNPVVDSFEAELRNVLGFLRRLRSAREPKGQQHDNHRRGANTLFNIWIKYKPRLPEWYYNKQLLKVGDSLAQIKEYKLAVSQCYGRYLQQFISENLDDVMGDVHQFKSTFFPSGVRDDNAALTFHALQERNACMYQMVCSSDRNLQNQESLQTCFTILSSLRLAMQVALPQENLCWLIYNGTIYIYTICRHLMMRGQSAKVLDYLLWASICMESSIPLLSVHYLTWRATLYAAVSQCYFDCQASIHGEVFARRGLLKINELKQLEHMSSSLANSETRKIFSEATLKMSVMVFKRAVFEPRRKPKTYLRPKLRVTLKEPQNLSLTVTKQLLTEMFDSMAAQFLAILEALSDSSRRLWNSPSALPDETEIRDVLSELFSAGLEILSGGVSSAGLQGSRRTAFFCVINASSTLLQLILKGEDEVSGEAAMKFMKLAFSYEEWDVFDSALEFVDIFLQAQDDPVWKKAEMELKLLKLMQPLLLPRKLKHRFSISEKSSKESKLLQSSEKKQAVRKDTLRHGEPSHDLIILATAVLACVSTPEEDIQPDKEILVDVVVFLWQKCKKGLQKIPTSGSDCLKHIHKYKAYQWVQILWIINEAIQRSSIAEADAAMLAEVTLCLTAILENVADAASKPKAKAGKRSALVLQDETCDMPEILMKTPPEQLQIAYESLERAISAMNASRLTTLLPGEKSAFDSCCTKVDSNDQNLNFGLGGGGEKAETENGFVMDLHLELIQTQHRVAVKLLKMAQGAQKENTWRSGKSHVNVKDSPYLTEGLIMRKIKKNKLSRAVFLMQKAAQKYPEDLTTASQRQLLKEALTLVEQVEAEQKALYHSFREAINNKEKSKTPPPPLLLSRSHCSMTFKPAPFFSDIQVSWYSILGSVAEGSTMKVRLNNNKLPNAGEEVPADGKSLLEIQGLETNEKYIFAVAAYAADGKLIGDAIGETTKPILAYPPLSATTVRAYLTQVAYQTGNYTLAREAFSPMWDYFVSTSSPVPATAAVISAHSHLTLSEKRLRFEALSRTSPITLQLFLRNIFVACDIGVMERALFCDSIHSSEVLYKEQVARLAECERMTVAIELSNWLNDTSYTLQSVVQCYGLLAPMIYHKISAVPVIQILIKCLAVLQEIPSAALQRKKSGYYESIQHMIACTSFYTAKVLRSWKEYELAVIIVNYGKKLLDSSAAGSPCLPQAVSTEETHKEVKPISSKTSDLAAREKATENLNALESNLLRLTKPARGSELTGQEDPFLLYPVVSCWTSSNAFREVMKFRNKSRFLEFFVQVLQKVLNEEKFQSVLEWAEDVQVYLKRRNNHFLSSNGNSTPIISSPTLSESMEKHTAGAGKPQKKSEASTLKKPRKEALSPIQHKHQSRKKSILIKSLEAEGKSEEELLTIARHNLVVLLKPLVRNYLNRKIFKQIYLEEMPWRSQMNICLAVAHYNLFKMKLDEQYNVGICGSQHLSSYNILDPDIFSLSNSGVLMVRDAVENNMTTPTPPVFKMSRVTKKETSKSSGRRSKLSKTSTLDTEFSGSSTESNKFLPNNILLQYFTRIFLHLRRAVVLAHRGGYWTLLQNACRELWNYAQEFQLLANHSHFHPEALPITRDLLRNTIWLPFYLAADTIIDMIIELQASRSLKIVDPEGDFCIPSCLGGIMDENGGSSLHPQSPLDDVNVVDLKWICNLILKTIELLYQMKKWESLVHIAAQFNTVTHEAYTGQVGPLLVYAQRQLLKRIEKVSGPGSQESPFIKYLSAHVWKMSCRHYIGHELQLPVAHSASGCFFSPEMINDYTDHSRAKGLVNVPLDVDDTLRCFRESLRKSKYHSRALRHSRKMLSLFLAHTQETAGRALRSHTSSKRRLEFNVGAEVILEQTPRDLSDEKFNTSNTVERKPIPKSHLSEIITSYEQTIGILEINKQRDLKVQALHELGNLHFYAGKKRAAFKCWCQALDETLNIADALNNWQELCVPKNTADCFAVGRWTDISQEFLSQAGVWGCLHAAVLVAKIAQHITTAEMRLRTKHCYFSAMLFKSLFGASLPHPTSDCDFAQYETRMLVPGIDLFSDRYRADISTVLASLDFLMFELHCAKQNFIILPLCTLYHYIVSEICKDPARCIEGRIFKMKVLTDIGFFTEAFHELSLLNCGERIPWKIPAGYRKTEVTKAFQKFDSSKSLLTATNLQVLENVFNWSLPLPMVPLCSQQMINKFALAKMHLIICLSATIHEAPVKVEKHFYSVDHSSLKEPSRITARKVKGGADKNSGQREQRGPMVQLVDCKVELNMAMLKGILLTEAEEILSCLVQNLKNKYNGETSQCSAEDLEALIEAKLQLAAICQQRHQAASSVALAFSAIRLLQDANIFREETRPAQGKGKERERLDSCVEDAGLPPSVTARDRINVRLWLRCHAALVTALLTPAAGCMEENDVAECRSVIKEVILEAEAFGDIETQAEMMLQAAILDLQEEHPVAGIKLLLQSIISLLQEDAFISPPASLTLVKSMLLLAELPTLQTAEGAEHCSSTVEPLNLLIGAHELTIKAIFVCGEPIEQQIEDSTLTCLVLPTKNIYLPHINLLARVKMRIGHALAEKGEDPLRALKHLESALKLCRASATQNLTMEDELLFKIGKVEQQITEAGNRKSPQAAETLMEPEQLRQQHDQKFDFIRLVLLLYAYNTKPAKISSIKIFSSMTVFSSHLWILLARMSSSWKNLPNLKQQAEKVIQSPKSLASASEAVSFLQESDWLKKIAPKKSQMND
ncbi:cilia- and flagella-associated protein 54 [Melanerpes formicivorus]|uniref:cilia- and flagella-associated protein 54 n=1 Tax=Melanerpes formicivorus TaxID=211600 RepID=UPI00358E33FA